MTAAPEDGGVRQHRWVLHVDMDAFFASCEQLTRPTLRGRPVLVGGVGGRGVVAGCSYEARVFGAHSAMPMHQARRLVGATAVVLPPRMAVYKLLSRRMFEVLAERVPVVEQVSVDEAFLEPPELRGATVAETRQWSEGLREAIRDATGLPASVGAGAGKQYAKIASGLAKPDGVYVMPRGEHPTLLDPLPVRSLWGVGPVAGERLAQFGITTVGALAAMADDDVAQALGRTVGPAIAAIARGHDERPVHPRAEAKQISAESTFSADLTTSAQVMEAVRRSAGAAHRRLVADGRAARTVTVKVRRPDFSIATRSASLPTPTSSLEAIVRVAGRLAPDPVAFGAIRLLGVGVSGLTEIVQDPLFEELPWEGGPGAGHTEETDLDAEPPDIQALGTTVTTEADADADGDPAVDGDGGGVSAIPAIGAWRGATDVRWPTGADVAHPEYGHGWVQGSGRGRVSVRFETATTGPGRMRTFAEDDPELRTADPRDSLG